MLRYMIYFVAIFVILLSSAYGHYLLFHAFEIGFYIFFHGLGGMFLGSILLFRWSNVDSSVQLATKLNRNNNAEKEDQWSLKYGTLVLFPSLLLVILSTIDFP